MHPKRTPLVTSVSAGRIRTISLVLDITNHWHTSWSKVLRSSRLAQTWERKLLHQSLSSGGGRLFHRRIAMLRRFCLPRPPTRVWTWCRRLGGWGLWQWWPERLWLQTRESRLQVEKIMKELDAAQEIWARSRMSKTSLSAITLLQGHLKLKLCGRMAQMDNCQLLQLHVKISRVSQQEQPIGVLKRRTSSNFTNAGCFSLLLF